MPLREYFEFCQPTKVMFGSNIVEDTGAEAEALGASATRGPGRY